MKKYKEQIPGKVALNTETNTSFLVDCFSEEAKEYKLWLSQGNTPDLAESLDELYNRLYNEVTAKTSDIINGNGFVYGGVPFYTDATAQQNFTALLIMKDALSYPFTVWDGNGSVALADAAELSGFCGQLFSYIAAKRTEGKIIRDGLQRQEGETDETYRARLESFADPRTV